MLDGFDEIDMSEADHVAWVRAQGDPALWHQAAMAALAYRGNDHGFLHWLLEQPTMDRSTAGWLFLWPEGSRYLRGEADFPLNHISSEKMVELFRALCARSERLGFTRDEIGLDQDSSPSAGHASPSSRAARSHLASSSPGKSLIARSSRRNRVTSCSMTASFLPDFLVPPTRRCPSDSEI